MNILIVLTFLLADQLPISEMLPTKQVVTASWYGPGFEGKKMAGGEIFDRHCSATVAHKNLPMGTMVILRNPEIDRFLIVSVKDRGPFIKNRDFDVSEKVAEILGFKDDGVAKLEAIWLAPITDWDYD